MNKKLLSEQNKIANKNMIILIKKAKKQKLRKIQDSAKVRKHRKSLIETITWFLDEYRENVKVKDLVKMEKIIENNYGDQIAKDWL